MEDRHSIHQAGTWKAPDPDITYLAIYDGHGGRDMVDFLEHAMPFHVAQELEAAGAEDVPMETRMERAFLMADIHGRHAGITASGATVALCLVKPNPESKSINLVVANAGDARVVLGQAGRPAERLSFDHSVHDPQEVQRIAQAGGFCWRNRVLGVLAVTRSLGDQLLKEYVIAEPTVRETNIPFTSSSGQNNKESSEQSFVILACDGLWDVISDQEAVDLVRGFKGEKNAVSKRLVQEGLTRGTTDNLTVIVAWL